MENWSRECGWPRITILRVPTNWSTPERTVTTRSPTPKKRMNRYGITADTRKCRRLILAPMKEDHRNRVLEPRGGQFANRCRCPQNDSDK